MGVMCVHVFVQFVRSAVIGKGILFSCGLQVGPIGVTPTWVCVCVCVCVCCACQTIFGAGVKHATHCVLL